MEQETNTTPCCNCQNRGKCKSCPCGKGRGCTNCQNPSCQFKTKVLHSSTSHRGKTRERHHPYAANSARNTGDPSRNQILAVSAAPENEQDANHVQALTVRLSTMSDAEMRSRFLQACQAIPEVMHPFVNSPNPQPFVLSLIPWCVCGRCQEFEDPRMNICCGYVSCLTQRSEFRNLCLRHDVIEVANILNWSFRTNLAASFRASTFRSQAYRNFVLWQHGRLGAGRRVPVPSCVCVAIRGRFPEPPGGQYSGYHSANTDSE